MAVSSDPQALPQSEGKPAAFVVRHALTIVTVLVLAAFLVAPWPFEVKARAVLHGICGQTESHTSSFDGRLLPLDDRCVGIYGGLLATFLILVALGRNRAAALPSPGALVVLLAFVAAMAIDGLNSLFTDLQMIHPYAPSNELRFLTGWITGIGLGTLMSMLTGMVLWRSPRTWERVLPSWRWPFLLLLPVLPAWLLVQTGSQLVYYPSAMLLMASAVVAFSALLLCAIVMLRNLENRYEDFAQVSQAAAVSMIVALGVLLAIGGARFWMEAITRAPKLV